MSATLAVAVLTAAYIGALLFLSKPVAKPFSFLALSAAMSASAAVLVWLVRREQVQQVRRTWLLLAGSASSSAVITSIWSYHQLVYERTPPVPSVADIFFVVAVFLSILAMLSMSGSPARGADRLRNLLDGLIVAVSLALVSWATVLGPAFHAMPTGIVEGLLLVAYPLGDVVALIVAALVVMRVPADARITIGLIAAGVASLSVGDSVFTYLTLRGEDPAGGLATIGWFAGYPLMALGALWWRPATKEPVLELSNRMAVQGAILPSIAAVLGLGVGFLTDPGPFVIVGGLVLIVLVLARQLLALSAESRYASALEARVRERTSEIAAQESRWRALVQNSSDAILVTDAQGIIRYESTAVERILGYGPGDRLGADRFDFVHPDDVERVRQEFADLVASPGSVSTIEFRQRHADGSWRWMEASKANLLHESEVGGIVSNYRDVTERKRMEAELARVRDAALEGSRLKSEFVANMSHEIRTPINAVVGLTGLLLGTELDARQRQYAEGSQTAAEALLGVINDILDFSKIEAGRLEMEVVDFNLAKVVQEASDLMADAAHRKGLEFLAYCDPRLPTAVRGDPHRLRQVLINLVSNAVKFTERGEVVLQALPAEELGGGDNTLGVHFVVKDTGVGIDVDQTERLFKPFAQADASTTRRYGGTGLGLAISAELVAAMGGRLQVDSRPGEGSRFWFTLVLERQPDGQAALPAYPHPFQGLRVLIVDENETDRLVLCEQMRAWQFDADAVEDAHSAVERLRAAADQGSPYQLALLDVCMDPVDRLELARRISIDPRPGATRLILLSSPAELDDAAGIDVAATLIKPVRQSQLYDTLARVMRRGQPARGRVLVVEDHPANQMVAVGILGELNYTADVAGSGLEAVKKLEHRSYVAVLMDCQMPEMDGYQATAEIRRREANGTHIPIIAMTASAMEGDRERCLAVGMDDYVSKPVHPAELGAVLERWVTGSPTAHPAASELDPSRLEVLRRMGRGDGNVLRRVANSFLAEATTELAALNDAMERGDSAAAFKIVHRLRGAAATVGANTMATACSEIEDLLRAAKVYEASYLLAGLQEEYHRAVEALRVAIAEPAT